jgi:hypothetical protein
MYPIFIFCPNTKTAGRFQGGIRAKNVQKTSKFQNKTGANFSAHLPTGVRFSKILTWLEWLFYKTTGFLVLCGVVIHVH